MKSSELKEESPQSYIETETVSSARALYPTDVQLSQLIREHYIREEELHQQSINVAPKKKSLEAKDYIYSANYDTFTGLINPRYMTMLLEKSLQIAKEREKVLAILYLELNGLKEVKNIYGHAIADEVLIIAAKRLKLAVRKRDHLSHLYGNTYLVSLMMKKKSLERVESISENIIEVISKPMNIKGFEIVVSMDICVVAYPIHGDKISVLLDIAKMKMYKVNKNAS